MGQPASHWKDHARQWQWLASPLRPAPEDVAIAERAVERWRAARRPAAPRALLLGVTPEIATMRWPARTRLLSVDHSTAMIRGVWPGAALDFAAAACAVWSALPLAGATQDIIACDGGFTGLAYPAGYRAVAGEARRVLRANGLLLARFFVSPDGRESAVEVWDDLRRGNIGNFHVFKWRLAMALHRDPGDGVKLADIWDAWNAAVPDPVELARRQGWPLPSVQTIGAYRGVAARYTFPTLAQVRAAMAGAFEEIECVIPAYELGARCPTLIFGPR